MNCDGMKEQWESHRGPDWANEAKQKREKAQKRLAASNERLAKAKRIEKKEHGDFQVSMGKVKEEHVEKQEAKEKHAVEVDKIQEAEKKKQAADKEYDEHKAKW